MRAAARRALGLALGVAVFALPATLRAADQSCDVPAYITTTESALPKVKAAIDAGKLDVLVLGSRSSTLTAANAAYPARLEALLREKLPKVQVSVALEMQAKKTAEEVVADLARAIAPRNPTLVIWQTGTVDSMRSIDTDEFRAAVEDGVATLQRTSDVVLMNLQFSPRTETMMSATPYVDNMRVVAQGRDVPLFDRFAIMRYWSESGEFDFFNTTPGDALARQVHDCLARALTTFVLDAARNPPAESKVQR